MIRFRCLRCSHKIRTSDQHAGKVVRCPSCKELTFVPSTVDEIEAALAAVHGETAESPINQEISQAVATQPPASSLDIPAGDSGRVLKPHEYKWLKFMASTYIAFGAVALLFCVIWMMMQLSASMSARPDVSANSGSDIFLGCVVMLSGLIATATLFAIGQVIFAFRDMVQNSWITRELAALQRSSAR